MIAPSLHAYVAISAALFALGFLGVLVRRNTLVIFMSLELMLVAATLALVAFSRYNGTMDGECLRLLHPDRGRRRGRGGPGDHRRPLPPAADDPGGPPRQLEELTPGPPHDARPSRLPHPLPAPGLGRRDRAVPAPARVAGRRDFGAGRRGRRRRGLRPRPGRRALRDRQGVAVPGRPDRLLWLRLQRPRRADAFDRRPDRPVRARLLARVHAGRRRQGEVLRRPVDLHVLDARGSSWPTICS